MTLAEFILAREGELRAKAQAVVDAHEMNGWESYIADAGDYEGPASTFAELMTPARVLRQCDAIRTIVALYGPIRFGESDDGSMVPLGGDGPETYWDTLTHLAAIWSDHPDYREEWAA